MATNDLTAALARLTAQRKRLQAGPALPQGSLQSLFAAPEPTAPVLTAA